MDSDDIFLHSIRVILIEVNFISLNNFNLTKPLNLPMTSVAFCIFKVLIASYSMRLRDVCIPCLAVYAPIYY